MTKWRTKIGTVLLLHNCGLRLDILQDAQYDTLNAKITFSLRAAFSLIMRYSVFI